MQGESRVRRQKILEKIRGLNPHAAEICEASAAAFAVKFLQAAEQALNPDKIVLRMLPGVFHQERRVPAAEFHFKRLGLLEKLIYIA